MTFWPLFGSFENEKWKTQLKFSFEPTADSKSFTNRFHMFFTWLTQRWMRKEEKNEHKDFFCFGSRTHSKNLSSVSISKLKEIATVLLAIWTRNFQMRRDSFLNVIVGYKRLKRSSVTQKRKGRWQSWTRQKIEECSWNEFQMLQDRKTFLIV